MGQRDIPCHMTTWEKKNNNQPTEKKPQQSLEELAGEQPLLREWHQLVTGEQLHCISLVLYVYLYYVYTYLYVYVCVYLYNYSLCYFSPFFSDLMNCFNFNLQVLLFSQFFSIPIGVGE